MTQEEASRNQTTDNNKGLLAIRILLFECFRSEPGQDEDGKGRIKRERSDIDRVDKALTCLTGTKQTSSKIEDLMIDIASQLPFEGERPTVKLATAVRRALTASVSKLRHQPRTDFQSPSHRPTRGRWMLAGLDQMSA